MKKTVAVISMLIALLAARLQAGEIHDAAAAGNLNKVRTLIEANSALLESKDDNGFTPLSKACFTKQVVVANFLLDKGANVNVRDSFQMTPLHRASYVSGQDLALLQRLIDKGADVNAQGNNGLTPLHFAAYSGGVKIAKFLIEHSADPNAYDKYSGPIVTSSISGTVLQVAIRFSTNDEMAKLLVENGAKLNKKDSSGNTELHLASLKGYADLVRLLVKHGGDVDAVNEYGRTALYYAAGHGYRSVADVLIAAGAKESAIVETNYGKAPQLTATLKEGEAYLWYLGGGYAVKTKGHLILFNPEGIDESLEAGLANGHLNPNELTDLKITVLTTVPERFQYGTDAFKLKQRMPGIDLVFGVKPPAGSLDSPDRSSYRLAAPNEYFSVGGVQVHTIPATAGGMGYLIEADGVKIFHAGFHVSDNDPSNLAKYRKEIDFLKPFGPIDVAILSVHSHSNNIGIAYEPYLYLLDQFSPKAVYLWGANLPEQYLKCAEVLRKRNIPVEYAEGGTNIGERFHFLRPQAAESEPSGKPSASLGDTGSHVQSETRTAVGNYIELQGTALGEISRNSASIMNSHVSIYVDRLGKSGQVIPEQAMVLKAAGKTALDAKDYYRAYRLQARALGWVHGENKVEHYEVAASLALGLNRAIFGGNDNITLFLRPLFTLGHPLANRYTAQSWLETKGGVIPGTEQKLAVTELKEFHFDHAVQSLNDGVIAVCYRLVSPNGETLAELKHAVVVAKDVQVRLDRMKANTAAAKRQSASGRSFAFVSALDTIDYNIRSLEQERTKFEDGNTGRSALPLGKYLIKLNWTAIGRPVDSFPQFDARLRYPQDVDFAESLITTTLAADPDALLKMSGEMTLASISTKNDELLRYRIFVPKGYDRAKKYSLIVALHSGGGDGEFFEFEKFFPGTSGQENGFKRLAQKRGYILVCPNGGQAGFFGERGETDILDIVERVRSVYSIDPNRVFVTGWSGGSEASWRIAMKYPGHFGAAAPVGVTPGITQLLTPQNAERARDLPVLYSVPGTETEQGRIINTTAKGLLRNFTYTEYPDADHAEVWLKAQRAVFDFFDTVAASAQENKSTASAGASQSPISANYLELQGTALGEVTQHDAMMLDFHVPIYVDRLKQSGKTIPEQVKDLLAAARAANEKQDYYLAFRLYARAAGIAEGKIEQYEVAAAFKLSLNRAIFASGENITLTVRPLFTLGHPLANRYTIHTWLETETGVITGSDQTLTVSELKQYHFDYPAERLQDGVIAVGYRLTSPTGETMAELRQAVVVAKNIQKRLEGLKTKFAAAKQRGVSNQSLALVSALATIEYNIQNLEWERTKFDGNWQRAAHPFGMFLGRMNFIAMGRPAGNTFPQFNARLRYPQDIAFAESLADTLGADPDTLLKRSGDMAQAFFTSDGKLLRYRIYVPRGYDRTKKYSLIVALHSGAGDSTYFEWEDNFSSPGQHIENRFKQLAQEKGYIVVCPNGVSGTSLSEHDDPDVVALAQRVQEMYSVEPKRMFLTGWSLGASTAWRIAMQHPELFAAVAPVGGNADWLNRQNTEKARNLPILYSVTAAETQGAQSTIVPAKNVLSNFSYKEYPDTDHITVWSKALPDVFDFFDARTAGSSPPGPTPATPTSVNLSGPYLGQNPPGATPEVFARGIVSTIYMEHSAPAFSPDGNEVFWNVAKGFVSAPGVTISPKTMKRINGRWTVPEDSPYGGAVSFSPDGKQLYFSQLPAGNKPDGPYFVEKRGSGWSEPHNVGLVARFPELMAVHGPTVTRDGTLYFVADTAGQGRIKDHRIYRSKLRDGNYSKPDLLPRCINLPDTWNYTPFIAPDESYLLFSSNRPGSLDANGDLYVSFHDIEKDTWSEPVSLGEPINTRGQESNPGVSPDGKYLFFTGPSASNQADVYWVSASVIEPLRLQARGWTNLTGDYLGQPPPGATPQVFARGIVSTDEREHGTPAFSPDGNEVFWPGTSRSMTMRRENGRWTAPRVSPYPNMLVYSADGKRLYFGAPRPGATREDGEQDIWVAEKQGDDWSTPKCLNLISQSPELQLATWPTIARNGNLYFISSVPEQRNKLGIARAKLINGQYAKPELLPNNINMAPYRNWAPFIAPDESYMLFSSTRPGSLDNEGDLYISRPLSDGKWSDPVRLGTPINTEYQERFSGLSPDGKFFFFTRWSPEHDEDVYWVDAASVPELRP